MNIHDVSEQAYKNGYKDGVKEFAKRLKQEADVDGSTWWIAGIDVDKVLREMVGDVE